MLASCITPGSITHEQDQQASETSSTSEISGTVNNLELTVANSAQATEELKAGQEQIKGKLEKLEHDLNFKMDELNKRLDKLAGVQASTTDTKPVAEIQPVAAGTQTDTGAQTTAEMQTSDSQSSNIQVTNNKQITTVTQPESDTAIVGSNLQPKAGIDLNKMSLDQRYKTAKKLEQEKKYDEAEKYYTSMVGIPSKWYDERARFFLGSMYYDMNKKQESIVTLQDFIDKYPNSKSVPKAILLQADSFVALSQKSNAEIFYKDLITRFPKTKEAEKAKSSLKKI